MQAIARAESGCNQANHNLADKHDGCMGSYGALQIGCIHYNGESVDDFKVNIELAHRVWQSQGYTAWTQYSNGEYKEFMK